MADGVRQCKRPVSRGAVRVAAQISPKKLGLKRMQLERLTFADASRNNKRLGQPIPKLVGQVFLGLLGLEHQGHGNTFSYCPPWLWFRFR